MSKLYNEAKKRFIEPITKKIFKPQKTTGTEVISKIKPNVPDNILDKARRDLRLAKRRTAGSEAKLKTTQFEIGQGQKDLTFDYMKKDVPKKSQLKGGRLQKFAKGGRVEYKKGTPNPFARKSKLKKIQEAFKTTPSFMVKKDKPKKRLMAKKGSPDPKKKKKFPDLTGDGKVTFADILKGRGVINGKKKTKKKII